MNKVIFFNKNNSKVKSSILPFIYYLRRDCVINPNLFGLDKVPSWFLKKKGGRVIQMNRLEKIGRERNILQYGLDERFNGFVFWAMWVLTVAGGSVGYYFWQM